MPLLGGAITSLKACGTRKVIIDGFPRDVDQAKAAEDVFGAPYSVLYFECPRDIAKDRYMSRSLAGRDDDPMNFDKRYEEFSRMNGRVIGEYERRKVLYKVSNLPRQTYTAEQCADRLERRDRMLVPEAATYLRQYRSDPKTDVKRNIIGTKVHSDVFTLSVDR